MQDAMNQQDFRRKRAPSYYKLGACLIYEALTLIALAFFLSALFVWLVGDATQQPNRLFLQVFIWVTVGGYYVRCWTKKGQTLAMRAWKLTLVNQIQMKPISLKQAVLRYVLSTLGLLLLGMGFLWSFLDSERRFLHDRLIKSVILVDD